MQQQRFWSFERQDNGSYCTYGESSALMLYVHLFGAVVQVVPLRAVHSLAMLPGFFQTAV